MIIYICNGFFYLQKIFVISIPYRYMHVYIIQYPIHTVVLKSNMCALSFPPPPSTFILIAEVILHQWTRFWKWFWLKSQKCLTIFFHGIQCYTINYIRLLFLIKISKNVPTDYEIELFAVFVDVLILLVSILFALVVNWQKQVFFLFRECCISSIQIVPLGYYVYFQAASADIKYIFVIVISVLVLSILWAFLC